MALANRTPSSLVPARGDRYGRKRPSATCFTCVRRLSHFQPNCAVNQPSPHFAAYATASSRRSKAARSPLQSTCRSSPSTSNVVILACAMYCPSARRGVGSIRNRVELKSMCSSRFRVVAGYVAVRARHCQICSRRYRMHFIRRPDRLAIAPRGRAVESSSTPGSRSGSGGSSTAWTDFAI